MAQYIDKAALIAEIERRKKYYENIQMIKSVYESNIEDLNELLFFLDTIEVREVDLDEEIEKYLRTFSSSHDNGIEYSKKLAKHFFSLGLKTQKGE